MDRLLSFALLFFLSACQSHAPHMENQSLHIDDPSFASDVPPSLPLAPPPPLPPRFHTLVSTTIFSSTPLREVLMDLAGQAEVGMALGEDVGGGITLSLHQQPFIEVVEQICHLAGLRYRLENETLFLEKDTPIVRTYNVQFLNLQRQTHNRMAVTTDLASTSGGAQSGGGVNDNSANHVTNGTAVNDFWGELKTNLDYLLQEPMALPSEDRPSYTFHRQGGLVTARVTERQHRQLSEYLDQLQKTVSSQVLIEAKIVEVSLNEGFQSGVNWQAIYQGLNTQGKFGLVASGRHDVASIALKHGTSLSTVLNMLEKYGTTKTLSSPRITVINNQAAVLKVAENSVYFRLKYNRYMRGKDGGGDVILTSSDIQTVPIGLILTVQPSINHEQGEITLALRPTVTSSSKVVHDPAVEIASDSKVESTVPVVEVREIDSILHMRDGEVIVLGGLMQERHHDSTVGLPGLRRTPLVGGLFRGDETQHHVVELIIFLKATILKPPSLNTPILPRKRLTAS